MRRRRIVFHSTMTDEFRITNNKSIMRYAREYVKDDNNKINTLKLINHVRLYKRVYLPCELLGQSGRDQTIAYRDKEAESQIKWTFYHHKIGRPLKKAFKRWNRFVIWLQSLNVKTIFDFDDDAI